MRKGLKIAGSTAFGSRIVHVSVYCMVAGAKSGAVVYVVKWLQLGCLLLFRTVCRASLYPPASSKLLKELSIAAVFMWAWWLWKRRI